MRKIFAAAAGTALLICTAAVAIGTAGSKNDPLITVSYLENQFMPSLKKQMADKVDSGFQATNNTINSKLTNILNSHIVPSTDDEIAAALAAKMAISGGGYQSVKFSSGSIINGKLGMKIMLEKGSARILSGNLINLTDGKDNKAGSVLKLNNSYLVPETANVQIETLDSDCEAKISGMYTETKPANPRVPVYTTYADALKTLGLFQGTEKGYELDRPATRIEGLVMLIRLLGEEKAAQNYSGTHPFKDVLPWSQNYVAYAYHKGYTKGSTATTFGGSSKLSASEYMTFLLRALEYNDSNGDFAWNEALKKSVDFGVLNSEDMSQVSTSDQFYRDHIVFTSYKALVAKIKGGSLALNQKLLGNGAITQENLDKAKAMIGTLNE